MMMNFRRWWQYTLALAMLMFIIGIAIDAKDVTTYTRRVRHYIEAGDYEKALQVGSRSDKTDRQLMLLRMEALDHEHLLGERLFNYPVVGRGDQLAQKGGDYELCAYLIDKKLDRFVAALPKYYPVNEQLPRHYREALVLYRHLRANPVIVYHDNVMDTDYEDLQEQKRRFKDKNARQVAVFQNYEGTYWYYFDFLNKISRK